MPKRFAPILLALLLLIGYGLVSPVFADPIDPSIIVRGASSGSYPINEPVETLVLTDEFFSNPYGGYFFVSSSNPPDNNTGQLVFANQTGQHITHLTIVFAIDDFFQSSTPGVITYGAGDELGFDIFIPPNSGSPFTYGTVTPGTATSLTGGFVVFELFGDLPPVPENIDEDCDNCCYDEGYFSLDFNGFVEGMTMTIIVPEPGSLVLLVIGLCHLLIPWRRIRF